MRLDQHDTSAFNTHLRSGRFSYARKVLASNATLSVNGSIVNSFDPGGVDRTVTMPPLQAGRFFVVANVGTANTLTVKTGLGTTINVLAPGETTVLFSGANEWVGANAPLDLAPFGRTGPTHSEGLVPDPGVGPVNADPTLRRFLGELGWQTLSSPVTPSVDFFYSMKGGAVTVTPLGTSALEYTTGNSLLTILGNSGSSPKSINFTLNQGLVDHNALTNYSANQHVDHTTVTMTAGLGIAGGGTIAASRSFDFAPSELTIVTPTLADYALWDIVAGGPRRGPWSSVNAIFDHNALVNYSVNRHIDHSVVSIVASTGLSGGGDITTSRSLALDINSLTTDVPAVGDFLPFYDISGGDTNKVAMSGLNSVLDHNALLNYAPNQHFPDAASDSVTYGRRNAAWTGVPGEAPSDGVRYARRNVGWTALPNITVSNVAPSSPAVNDVWIDTT